MPFGTQRSLISFFLLLITCNKLVTQANKTENVWRSAGRLTGLLIHNCMQAGSYAPQEQFLLILQECLKRRSLLALDNCLRADVLRLGNGVELVRYKMEDEAQMSRDPIFLRSYKLDKSESDWKRQILQRIAHVFNTHVLKIRLNSYGEMRRFIGEEGRGRKRNNMLMSVLLFGVLAIGLIMVPMGFQFLAVLGGKALLLAKLALILTAIQGLKKIATSNLNYGLYTTPEHHRPCKDDFCRKNFRALEGDDSDVFLAVDLDELRHQDREWPYDSENHEAPGHGNFYRAPEQQSDWFHPLMPRVDKNFM